MVWFDVSYVASAVISIPGSDMNYDIPTPTPNLNRT